MLPCADLYNSTLYLQPSSLIAARQLMACMVPQVPWQRIEEAFWNVVEEGEEEVEVLYGADLDSTIFGSAFPTKTGRMQDSKYAESPWNLNNLPRLPGKAASLLASLPVLRLWSSSGARSAHQSLPLHLCCMEDPLWSAC